MTKLTCKGVFWLSHTPFFFFYYSIRILENQLNESGCEKCDKKSELGIKYSEGNVHALTTLDLGRDFKYSPSISHILTIADNKVLEYNYPGI